MAKSGPKLTVIDWQKVNQMCIIQCTGEEIASVLNIDYDTLQRSCKRDHKVQFADYIKERSAGGRASLRRNQWKAAENLNPTMLVWLGKNMLGQKDKSDEEIDAMKSAEPIVIVRAEKK